MKHGDGIYYYSKTGHMYQGEWKFGERNGFGDYSVRKSASPSAAALQKEEEVVESVVDETIKMRLDAQKLKFVQPKGRDFPLASSMRKVYAGEWLHDQKCGTGIFFYENGDVYDGNWVRDQREGWGRMSYADGSVYEGEWHEEKRHGQGILLMGTHATPFSSSFNHDCRKWR